MPENIRTERLMMDRQQLDNMRLERHGEDLTASDGEVVFKLALFSLTTNNITYAAYGDALNYWAFFPLESAGWGQLPVWGYADVIGSTVAGIEQGQRYFGYFPTATHLKVRPGKTGRHSFRDDSQHRQPLPEIYNWYQRTDNDPFHQHEAEPLHAIYRPLFVTAFCLADFLADHNFFGAGRVLISSASSKTAYATAFCLQGQDNIDLVGLTSPSNCRFVEHTGLYDQVVTYPEIDQIDHEPTALYVDVAGNLDLRDRIHRHLDERLVYDCTVGSAQSIEPPTESPALPGPKPKFFFAPVQIAKRHQDWGVADFDKRVGMATKAFYDHVNRPNLELLKLNEHSGLEAAQKIIADLLAGNVDPREGHVVRLTPDTS